MLKQEVTVSEIMELFWLRREAIPPKLNLPHDSLERNSSFLAFGIGIVVKYGDFELYEPWIKESSFE